MLLHPVHVDIFPVLCGPSPLGNLHPKRHCPGGQCVGTCTNPICLKAEFGANNPGSTSVQCLASGTGQESLESALFVPKLFFHYVPRELTDLLAIVRVSGNSFMFVT